LYENSIRSTDFTSSLRGAPTSCCPIRQHSLFLVMLLGKSTRTHLIGHLCVCLGFLVIRNILHVPP
jgi:hypothetical protein